MRLYGKFLPRPLGFPVSQVEARYKIWSPYLK